MATAPRESRERGLPSLNQARAERRRAIVLGKVRMPGVPMHFWLWTAVGFALFAVLYWRVAQGQVEAARSGVMAKQRAMAVALGPKLFPFRDRVEGWVRELSADPWQGDFVAPGIDVAKVQNSAAVYLRLRVASAKTTKDIRKAVQSSLRDGFTSCLFVTQSKADPTQGPPCRTAGDCATGQLCNEWRVCAAAQQPFNMRLAYRTLRVLSTEWTDEVHLANSELALSAYDEDLDKVAKRDVPVTVEVLSRARFFTLVLDEDPPGGLPAEIPDAGETPEERVQRAGHFARVGIWDLRSNQPVLRLRSEADAEFVMIGRRQVADSVNLAAQQRQVNGCQLALQVRQALGEKEAASGSRPLP